jgi:hypothetical protein
MTDSVTIRSKNPGAAKALLRRFASLTGAEVAVGWLEDATIPAINYFGAPAANIPPRDAVAPTVREIAPAVTEIAIAAGQTANNGRDPVPLLEGLALVAGAELKQQIRAFNDPRNADATIDKKGFDDPLIGVGGGRILDGATAVARPRET